MLLVDGVCPHELFQADQTLAPLLKGDSMHGAMHRLGSGIVILQQKGTVAALERPEAPYAEPQARTKVI